MSPSWFGIRVRLPSIASIPLGVTSAELIQRQNFVDDHVFDNLNTLGIPPHRYVTMQPS